MKALTLHQPWAWLVANHWKEVETRSWYTNYRGPLAIHAGKKRDKDGIALWADFCREMVTGPEGWPEFEELPFGAIVATCNLVACFPTQQCEKEAKKLQQPFEPVNGWDMERDFGNYAPGRFGSILRNVVPVNPPILAHGWQQIWNWQPPANLSAEMGLRA